MFYLPLAMSSGIWPISFVLLVLDFLSEVCLFYYLQSPFSYIQHIVTQRTKNSLLASDYSEPLVYPLLKTVQDCDRHVS